MSTATVAQKLSDLANKLRIYSIEMTNASNSGHPSSCCSMAEIVSVLFFHVMNYSVESPADPNSDRFVLSKGHTAPILYAAWAEAGLYSHEQLLTLRKITSDLEGHPTPRLPYVDVATGSLGQGLGAAAGMAYLAKFIEKAAYKVYCVMGDGESAEGSVWEAAAFSSFYNLDNLVGIIDVNRIAQSDPAPLQHNMQVYYDRWTAFGFECYVIDGHSVDEILATFEKIAANHSNNKPKMILAKTFKGHGASFADDKMGWHGKPYGDKAPAAIAEISARISDKTLTGKQLNLDRKLTLQNGSSLKAHTFEEVASKLSEPPKYELGQLVATRQAYGVALKKLGDANKHVVALDADVKNSTFSDKFKAAHPDRFVDCFIMEQNMVSLAIGMAARNRTVAFASTFAAFLSRAYDHIRMGAISFTNVNFCGSHVGVSIGEDGPSQMALEDLAMFRAVPSSTVFYPSDAVSMERAVELAANTRGICYIRSGRPTHPVIYNNDETFEVGKLKVVLRSDSDNILLVGAGVTLHEIVKMSKQLTDHGLHPRVVDPFTIKPIDACGLLEHARAVGGVVVTVEDHYIEGGLFDAVSAALASAKDVSVHGIAVNGVPRSGSPDELLKHFGISADQIIAKIKDLSLF